MTKAELEQQLAKTITCLQALQNQNRELRKKLSAYQLWHGNDVKQCKKCHDWYRDGYLCNCGFDNSYEVDEEQ